MFYDGHTPTRTAEMPAAPPAKKDLSWSTLGAASPDILLRLLTREDEMLKCKTFLTYNYEL